MSFKAKFAGECPVRAKFNSETPIKTRFQSFQRINSGAVVLSDTTENWNKKASLISELNTVYVYVDHQTKTDEEGKEVWIPGIKIGDGKAYLIDLPFSDELMIAHINDLGIHVTPEEKKFWNNKVRTYMDTVEGEQLVFTTL